MSHDVWTQQHGNTMQMRILYDAVVAMSMIGATRKHLLAADRLAHVVLVALGDHQVPRVVRAHVQARYHPFRQAARAACEKHQGRVCA